MARQNRNRRKHCSQRRFSHLLGIRKTTIRGSRNEGRERTLLPARLVFISGLSEGATIQPHICIFTEPYTQLGGLLTDADGKAIFHKVREKGKKKKKNQNKDRLRHQLEKMQDRIRANREPESD